MILYDFIYFLFTFGMVYVSIIVVNILIFILYSLLKLMNIKKEKNFLKKQEKILKLYIIIQ